MRLPDWPERLDACLRGARETPFLYGAADCALFAADCIAALTGRDPAAHLRGTYDAASVGNLLQACGGIERLAEAVAAANGFVPIGPRHAQRGDIVLLETPQFGPCLGVAADHRAAFRAPQGLAWLNLLRCARAWRIA